MGDRKAPERAQDAASGVRAPLRYWEFRGSEQDRQQDAPREGAPLPLPEEAEPEAQASLAFPPSALAERQRLRELLNREPPEAPAAESGASVTYGPIDRDAWERAVAKSTQAFRDHKAAVHRDKARIAKIEGEGGRYEWHMRRANGQDERFGRIKDCGKEEIHIHCDGCGHEMTQLVLTCKQWRVCTGCRVARARGYQRRFAEARREALKAVQEASRSRAVGGGWRESFLTLTLPHSGEVKRDIRALPELWGKFRRLVSNHLTRDLGIDKERAAFPYVRVLEVTPGEDHLGHAHLHAWLLSPYLAHECLRFWWGSVMLDDNYRPPMRPRTEVITPDLPARRRELLERTLVFRHGRRAWSVDPVPYPVIDIRACYGQPEKELIKYLVKDAERAPDGSMKLVDPELGAEFYKGFEGVRSLQTSAGFWPKDNTEGDVLCCEKCGSRELTSTRRDRETGQPIEGKPKRSRRPRQPKKERNRDRHDVTPAMADTLERMLPDCQNAAPPPRPKNGRRTSP